MTQVCVHASDVQDYVSAKWMMRMRRFLLMHLILSNPWQWVNTGSRDAPSLILVWILLREVSTGQTRRKKAYTRRLWVYLPHMEVINLANLAFRQCWNERMWLSEARLYLLSYRINDCRARTWQSRVDPNRECWPQCLWCLKGGNSPTVVQALPHPILPPPVKQQDGLVERPLGSDKSMLEAGTTAYQMWPPASCMTSESFSVLM